MTTNRLTTLMGVGMVAVWLAGCGGRGTAGGADNEATCAAVKIAVLLDQTGSTTWTRTPQLRFEDLKPLVRLVARCGGELGVGLIRDDSNRSLVRMRVEEPPVPPQEGNPLRVTKLRKQYQQREQRWRKQTDEQARTFEESVKALLARKADARCTDVWGAVLRANLFLGEPEPRWGRVVRWAIFVSDGRHNCGTKPVKFTSGAKVLVVNGSASLGVLGALRPLRFESPEAAFRYVSRETPANSEYERQTGP